MGKEWRIWEHWFQVSLALVILVRWAFGHDVPFLKLLRQAAAIHRDLCQPWLGQVRVDIQLISWKCVPLLSTSQDWLESNLLTFFLTYLFDILSDISSDIFFWHIFWHSFWHIFWHSFWHLSDISSDIFSSDISSDQKECQKICQKKKYQKICQKDVRKNVRRYVRKNVRRYVFFLTYQKPKPKHPTASHKKGRSAKLYILPHTTQQKVISMTTLCL